MNEFKNLNPSTEVLLGTGTIYMAQPDVEYKYSRAYYKDALLKSQMRKEQWAEAELTIALEDLAFIDRTFQIDDLEERVKMLNSEALTADIEISTLRFDPMKYWAYKDEQQLNEVLEEFIFFQIME